VRENLRLAVRGIAEEVNIDRETVRKILTDDLDMRKVCTKWSQRSSLKNKSKKSHKFLLEKQDEILSLVITDDETSVYQYDPETKRQSAECKTANPPKTNVIPSFQIKSQNKIF